MTWFAYVLDLEFRYIFDQSIFKLKENVIFGIRIKYWQRMMAWCQILMTKTFAYQNTVYSAKHKFFENAPFANHFNIVRPFICHWLVFVLYANYVIDKHLFTQRGSD